MRYHVETIPLDEYVKGVLPNEWGHDWDSASLQAGAVAVKQFAVSMQYRVGYVWDCNWSQVYDPSRRTDKTDKAVDDSWDYWIWDEGLITTYYDNYPQACLSRNQTYNCMSQWVSLRQANEGWGFRRILGVYTGEIVKVRPVYKGGLQP